MCLRSRNLFALVVLALAAYTGSVFADPPQRVARISVIRGDVSFAPAGDSRWTDASLNRPLVGGDKLYTERDARVELDVGAAVLRLDGQSGINVSKLDDRDAQIELTEGTLNLHVRRLYDGQTYEVNTPTLAFEVSDPGEYRIDVDPRGNSTQVTVFSGAGEVYGEGDARLRVDKNRSYRFNDPQLRDYTTRDLPRPDDFDNWSFARDDRLRESVARRYVSDDMIGASDLDTHGQWRGVPEYGNVWFPARVADDWAPYRDGHWAWIDPWGWTWVDDAPWGFAPFHYGRWVYVSNRWGWRPGPVARRAVYAPALVMFIGGRDWSASIVGGSRPVGWFPLGPRDVYVPPYRVSRGYFNNVNVSNTTVINNTHITNIYNNYAAGKPMRDVDYAYRRDPRAVTAVSRDTFEHARPVARGRMALKREQLDRAELANGIAVPPTPDSRMAKPGKTHAPPPRDALDRHVVVRGSAPSHPVGSFSGGRRGVEQERNRAQDTQRRSASDEAPHVTQGKQRAERRQRHAPASNAAPLNGDRHPSIIAPRNVPIVEPTVPRRSHKERRTVNYREPSLPAAQIIRGTPIENNNGRGSTPADEQRVWRGNRPQHLDASHEDRRAVPVDTGANAGNPHHVERRSLQMRNPERGAPRVPSEAHNVASQAAQPPPPAAQNAPPKLGGSVHRKKHRDGDERQ